ncbi:hypothetical protein [Xanthobacter flavus]|uniref:hypothetical protein n=1 Tax=Xanthobacter flavus TaxID=281 RepID=UPI00372AD268
MSATAKKAHVWARHPEQWYVEPGSVTRQLLTVERFAGPVLDPCCGQGNIVTTMIEHGVQARGMDLVRRVEQGTPWFIGESDFLAGPVAASFPNLVFNPPFFRAKGAEAFIRHAIGQASAKVAAFVDIRFITGAERANGLFAEHTPHRIWIVTPRVSCPPGEYLAAGNEAKGGTADWCWLVYDVTAPPVAVSQVGWLRRPAHG